MNTEKNIVIAEPHFLIAEGLKSVIGQSEKYGIAGVAETRAELDNILQSNHVSMLITDFSRFEFGHSVDFKAFMTSNPSLLVLIVANAVSSSEFTELNRLGIKNMILKSAGSDEIFEAIEATLKGKKYYAQEILDMIVAKSDSKPFAAEIVKLTTSESEIVRFIANGLTTKEIAAKKNVSFHTVNTHRKNIFRKLGVTNSSELIMLAIKAGWIENIEYYI